MNRKLHLLLNNPKYSIILDSDGNTVDDDDTIRERI